MGDLSWGGFNNGRIPTNLLTLVRGEPFRSDAAAQMLKFEAAFKAEFGYEFKIGEGYRSLERQKDLRAKYLAYLAGTGPWAPIANYVGHSVHGWGLAADLWSGIDVFVTQQHIWAVKNGPRFGWYWGSTPSEAWHFEFRPTAAFVSVDAAPIKNATPTPEEDDLMATPEQRAALISELLNHAAYDKGPTVSEVLKALDKGGRFIRIQAPNRGIALIGPGYYRSLASNEEVEQSAALVSKHLTGNDRQFDLWRSLAVGGK